MEDKLVVCPLFLTGMMSRGGRMPAVRVEAMQALAACIGERCAFWDTHTPPYAGFIGDGKCGLAGNADVIPNQAAAVVNRGGPDAV